MSRLVFCPTTRTPHHALILQDKGRGNGPLRIGGKVRTRRIRARVTTRVRIRVGARVTRAVGTRVTTRVRATCRARVTTRVQARVTTRVTARIRAKATTRVDARIRRFYPLHRRPSARLRRIVLMRRQLPRPVWLELLG